MYSETCVKRPLAKRQKIGFPDQLSLNAGKMYQGGHSAILSTFIKLPFVSKIFVLSIFELPFYTSFTVRVIKMDVARTKMLNSLVRVPFIVMRFIHSQSPAQIKLCVILIGLLQL